MIEEYMMEKFIERVNVLIYGFGKELEEDKEKLLCFLNTLCEVPFRSNVSFEFEKIRDNYIHMKGIISDKSIPFSIKIDTLYKLNIKKIPYRLSVFSDDLEIEIANKINNIILGEINMLDLYDIYMYFTLREYEIDEELLFTFIDKKININLVRYVDRPFVKEEWSKFKTSVKISFESVILVLEKIVSLSEKVLV